MLAVFAESFNKDNPLAGLKIGDRPEPVDQPGWTTVTVKSVSLNHHDLWTLRGVGITEERLPMTLGCDAAGVTPEGREVIVHGVISANRGGDDTLDPKRSLLSEIHQGSMAQRVAVPSSNLIDKPANLSFDEASCLPTAWLTAYRMLFNDSGLRPGDTVLIQGIGGGVATAATILARHAGMRVWATTRDISRAELATALGAHQVFEANSRLPEKVDAVIETVGKATWSHSLRSLRPGGTVVVSGATSGADPSAELNRVFFLQLRVIGSTMGSFQELKKLVAMVSQQGVKIPIDSTFPISEANEALAKLESGDVFGKIVINP